MAKNEPNVDARAEGGSISPVQLADVEGVHFIPHGADNAPVQRVTSVPTGAKRESFFRDRDYERES